MTTPLVMIVGRTGPEDIGFREGSYRAGKRYLDAISRAGGAGVIAPPIAGAIDQTLSLLPRVDALVLHGGGDIDPACYGEAEVTDELYGVVAVHDEVELAVCLEALRLDLPVLAICRGLQVLNVALRGTLHQHIGDEHRMQFHDVDVVEGSRLAKVVGPERLLGCHCVHHQAIDRLADGLDVVASTADGVIHAVEHREASWVVAVQWHPEDTAAADRRQQQLFEELIQRPS
jgi:putative glutamine amidotransferase